MRTHNNATNVFRIGGPLSLWLWRLDTIKKRFFVAQFILLFCVFFIRGASEFRCNQCGGEVVLR